MERDQLQSHVQISHSLAQVLQQQKQVFGTTYEDVLPRNTMQH